MIGRFQQRVVTVLPLWMRTQPLDAMFALLGIPSGLTLLIGPARSRALDVVLPHWATYLWGICLVLGCLAWLAGLTSLRQRDDGRLVITRLPVLLLGLQILSPAALVYGVAIIVAGGWSGVLVAWPLFVFAAATFIRRVELQQRERP